MNMDESLWKRCGVVNGKDCSNLEVHNSGDTYESPQSEERSRLKPDADILMQFADKGIGLTKQYTASDWTRKAYIAKNWDALTKMITNHKRIQREIDNTMPRFTKEDHTDNK